MTRKKADRAEWKRRVLDWQRSNETAAAYGRRMGISARSLAWWRWRLEKDGDLVSERATAMVPFLEVRLPAERASPLIEIGLGNGRVVRVLAGFDDETLMRVVAVLEEVGR